MKVKGMVFSGVLRGEPLIELYYHRMAGIIGYEPFRGTMDVKLERDIDVRKFSTKSMDHILMDGTKKVYAWFAPINIIVPGEGRAVAHPCWAMQQADGIYDDNIIEIIDKDYLKGKFKINDRDVIEVEFFETPRQEQKGAKLISRLSRMRRKVNT